MTIWTALAGFTLAAGLLVITPGLDMALVLRTLAVEGPRQALAAAAGVVTGVLAWGLIVALGLGALLALLEKTRARLAAEGLFAAERKQPLPFLPRTIGVVTSPSGAVIRDILHRLRERFPRKVLIWPVAVQGQRCAPDVVHAIEGFNALSPGGALPRPDLLIVARGGGSVEDLWGFNEESVARAAAASRIPLISAVGHETDTTLIDFVSDKRAPTPTAAAEIAVPVRQELLLQTGEASERLKRALARRTAQAKDKLNAARLPRPETLLQTKRQRLDYAAATLPRAALALTQKARVRLSRLTISPASLRSEIRTSKQRLRDVAVRARPALTRLMQQRETALASQGKLLETLSYQATLKRGYALVRDDAGKLVRSAGPAASAASLKISFADGDVTAVPAGSSG
mgnify:CR=1 FL=1